MELIEAYIKAEKGNIYYTKNSDMFLSMVKSIFISKNIPVRVYYDTIKQMYVFGNAFDYIHADLATGMKYYSKIYGADEMRANISYLKQNCALFQVLPDDDLKKYDMGDGYTHGWILPYEDMFFACRNNEYKKVRDEVPLFKDKVGFWQGTEYYEHQKSQQVVNESVEDNFNSKNNCKVVLKDGKIIYGRFIDKWEDNTGKGIFIKSDSANKIKEDDIKELYMYYDCEVILKDGRTIYGNFVGDYGDHKLHLDDAFNRKGWAIKDELIDKVNYKKVLKKELTESIEDNLNDEDNDWNSSETMYLDDVNIINKNNLPQVFWKWFGNSKIKDENGNPIICYHTSNIDFNMFKRNPKDGNIGGVAYFFTNSLEAAEHWMDDDPNQIIYDCFLKIENPYYIDGTQDFTTFESRNNLLMKSKSEGYDGAIIKQTDIGLPHYTDEYVAFYSRQIKLIDNKKFGNNRRIDESAEEKILYIIRGVPGSGKSTLAHKLTDNVVEADQYFYDDKGNYNWSADKLNQAHNWCFYTVKKYMEEGRDKIAVANTFVKNRDYKRYVELAKDFDYKVVIKTCTGNYKNIHNVPDETVERMRNKFQETPLDESVKYLNKEYSDTRIITSNYDMRDYLSNHKNLRIVYDKLNNCYFINDSEKAVHFNIMSDAIKAGFYNDYKVNSGIDLLLSNYYEQFVVFVVNDGSVPADAFNADDYTFEYKYDTFNIYDRDGQFINCPLYQILGMPNETNRIDGYNEDEDNENYYDEDEEEQLDESAENDKTLRDYAVKLANICLDALVKTKYETRISKEQIQINVDKAFKKAVPMLKYSSYEYFLLLVNEKDEPNPSFGKTVDKKYGLITFPIFSSDPSDLALSILYKHKSVIEKLYTTYSGDELKLKIHEYAVKYLKNEIKKRLENKKNIYLDLLIHECTHLLDDVRRTKTYKSKEQELKDDKGIEDYYNSPEEQNAYYQETISIFDEWANQSVGYKTFDIFWDDFIRQYKGEYNMLNNKNKRKLKKRAYTYWDVYMKD